jgi:hypothetical protein
MRIRQTARFLLGAVVGSATRIVTKPLVSSELPALRTRTG